MRVLVRPDARTGHLKALSVETATGDLLDTSSLRQACSGVDCVIATATAALPRRRSDTLQAVDGQGYRGLIDAARDCGVQHFIYTSMSPVRGEDKVPLFREKRATEQYLAGSDMTYTIIRAAAFMDVFFAMMGSEISIRGVETPTVERPFWFSRGFFERVRGDLERGRLGVLGDGKARHSFIALNDVAEYLVRSWYQPQARNAVFDVGGPEALTMREVVALHETIVGRKIRTVSTPAFVLGSLSTVLRPFSDAAANIMAMNYLAAKHDAVIPSAGETATRFDLALTTAEQFLRSKWQTRETEPD